MLQKYRADFGVVQSDGSKRYYAKWLGGDTLSKIENCRVDGETFRRTVYVRGEPDTYFSQPAACYAGGGVVRGYLTTDDDGLVFHPMTADAGRLAAARPRFYFLRYADEYLSAAEPFKTLASAVASYASAARNLRRMGQELEASIHVGTDKESLDEYPHYLLAVGKRGGISIERT